MKNLFFCQIIISLFFFISCSKNKDSSDFLETTLNQKEVTLKPGDTATISIELRDSVLLNDHRWTVNPNDVIVIESQKLGQISVIAENEGKAVISVYYPAKDRTDSCIIYVGKPNLVRILAIGNSFSEDALEGELYNLFRSKNRQIVIGNLYIGGADFTTHLNNALYNSPAYSYRKVNINGEKSILENISLLKAINDESWDFISMQQVSQQSGVIESFIPSLAMLHSYVEGSNHYRKTRYLLHQTWAYAPRSTHFGFALYNRNQDVMFNAICETYRSAMNLAPVHRVIPSGTAIQNARQTILGDDLTRDGFHLSLDVGRFIAACTWFEGLTRTDVRLNTYVPRNVSDTIAVISKKAAHEAIRSPFKVSR